MMRRGGCLVWGLGIAAVIVVGVVVAVFIAFGYFGPALPETDDVAEWRALGASAWGVEANEAGDWSAVRAVVSKLDEAETAAGAAPTERPGFSPERNIDYDRGEGDPNALAAIEAMRTNGLFEAIDRLLEAAPLHDGWGEDSGGPAVTSMFDASLGDLGGLRTVARAFKREMLEAMDRGEDAAALAAFDRMLVLSEVMGRQPVMISRLVGIAIRWLAIETVLAEATQGRLEGSELPSLAIVFEGERILSRDAVRTRLPGGPLVWLSPAAQFEPIDGFFDDAVAALDHDPRMALALLDDAWERVDERPRWMYPMAQVLLPSVGRAAVSEFSMRAREAGAVLALALERRRLRAGAFPASVDALVGAELEAVPADPYNEAGFVYRAGEDPTRPADAGGCVLYSMGIDGTDDGGTRPTGRNRLNPFDPRESGIDAVLLGPADEIQQGG